MDKFTLKEHFLALKNCVLRVCLFYVVGFVCCYYFSEYLLYFILKPLLAIARDGQNIIYTDLTEAFVVHIKISSYASLCLIYPLACWQLYLFVSPGLYPQERKILSYILIASVILFYLGGVFLYYLILPNAFLFLTSYENTSWAMPLILQAKISEYVSLFLSLIFIFAVSFQLPVVISILALLGLLGADNLRTKRRFIVVIIFILAAIFTPPDVFSQIALAIPLILLYEISIIVVKLIENRVIPDD